MTKETIDFKAMLRKALRYWFLFPLSMVLAGAGTYYKLKTTHPVYQASATVLITKGKESGQLSEESLFNELALGNIDKNLENEMKILSSTPIILDAVRKLNLNFQYFQVEPLLERDIYKSSPIKVANWVPHPGSPTVNAKVSADRTGEFKLDLIIEESEEIQEFRGEFGLPLKLPYGDLTLTKVFQGEIEYPIQLRITSPWVRAKELKENLVILKVGEESSLINLIVEDKSNARAVDFLNELISTYNQITVEKRNQVFKNTIDLINERINLLSKDLTSAERDVENYKSNNSLLELGSESNLLMEELSSYSREITDIDVQLTILRSIEEFLVANKEKFEFVPTNASLTNLTLNTQLLNFNELLSERDRLRNRVGEKHPDLILVERQIQNLRETIIENIQTIESDLLVAKESSQDLKANVESRIQSMPRRERELLEIERRKTVKENLYVYLLEKREESALSMSVTMPKGEVVEPPEALPNPIHPNMMILAFIGGVSGLAIPFGIIFYLVQFNSKIETEHDLESNTPISVAGVLSQMPTATKDGLVVKENSRTTYAEMFRFLRANIANMGKGNRIQTLLITSAISGEGKSFISLNLSVAKAMAGKRVILLETDFRKPGNQNIDPKENEIGTFGIVNYVNDPECQIDQIIKKSGYHPNLDIISCGIKPPNPGELVLSSRLRKLVHELRKRYDFIVFDSAPLGFVADALQMNDMVDATLLVLRARTSTYGHLEILNEVYRKGKLPNPFIVLNGVSMNDYQFRPFPYGYNYLKNGSESYFEKTSKA